MRKWIVAVVGAIVVLDPFDHGLVFLQGGEIFRHRNRVGLVFRHNRRLRDLRFGGRISQRFGRDRLDRPGDDPRRLPGVGLQKGHLIDDHEFRCLLELVDECPDALVVALQDHAGREAHQRGAHLARVLGVHLEGPFLNPARKGVHDAKFIRAIADEFDPELRTGWSVTAVGHSRAVTDPAEIDRLAELPLTTWAPGSRDHYIVVEAEQVSGRRITPSAYRNGG